MRPLIRVRDLSHSITCNYAWSILYVIWTPKEFNFLKDWLLVSGAPCRQIFRTLSINNSNEIVQKWILKYDVLIFRKAKRSSGWAKIRNNEARTPCWIKFIVSHKSWLICYFLVICTFGAYFFRFFTWYKRYFCTQNITSFLWGTTT